MPVTLKTYNLLKRLLLIERFFVLLLFMKFNIKNRKKSDIKNATIDKILQIFYKTYNNFDFLINQKLQKEITPTNT